MAEEGMGIENPRVKLGYWGFEGIVIPFLVS